MADRIAKRGDELVLVTCKCGTVGVLASKRPWWRCSFCKTEGVDVGTAVLGGGGALPEIAAVETSATGAAPGPRAENGGAAEDVSNVALAGGTWT